MVRRPPVLLFDVNGTLSDVGALGGAFATVGADPLLAEVWFASILRDGFAISIAGRNEPFAAVAEGVLPALLAEQLLHTSTEAAVATLMEALTSLPPQPDLANGIPALEAAGLRLATLTNGSIAITERLLTTAGVRERFERLLSVEDGPGWKPTPGAYEHALDALGVDASAVMLVAAHPWDIEGASAAGLRTAYLARDRAAYPAVLRRPDVTVRDLVELADLLGPA